MHRYEALEDLVDGWVRRHAPHVTRDALDALIDGATDLLRDSLADGAATRPRDGQGPTSVEPPARGEILHG